jgi:3-dehydroquinate dehydratase/shikimate dehydrogenase
MLFLTLPAKNLEFLKEKIQQYERDVDGFEIRWDFSQELYPDAVRSLTKLPLIFTLRTKEQGGCASKVFFDEILQLAKAKPDFLDLEYHFPLTWFQDIKTRFPDIKIIGSYHCFDGVPKLLPEMEGADILKLACFCKNSTEALGLLNFRHAMTKPYILIAMGPLGQFTRILAKALGSEISYACCPENIMAPGQLSIDDMNNIYRYRTISTKTHFYGLIGQPVDKSIGHYFHNDYFFKNQIDARYLKIEVSQAELKDWLTLSLNFPFYGFSVTTPLKIPAYELLGSLDGLPSINTLKRSNNQWQALNTDAPGAWNALGHTKPNSVIVLGAGGVGRAVSDFFLKKGCEVRVYNRTPKAGVSCFDETSNFPKVDLIINTIPNIPDELLSKLKLNFQDQTCIIDFVYPYSSLTSWAQKFNQNIISGEAIFIEQALLQQVIWNS